MPLAGLTDTVLVGDSLRLSQVLRNLLSNALKFTSSGGSIRLEIRQLQKKNGRVRLRFTASDTVIGMSGEMCGGGAGFPHNRRGLRRVPRRQEDDGHGRPPDQAH